MDPHNARCLDDQLQDCRSAVANGVLGNLDGGGICTVHKYDIYDQLCTLNSYSGGIDYCCCAHEKKALCCRFHFNHNYFRCDEEEDAISLPLSLTMTIVISLVVIIIFLVTIVTISVKCIRVRRTLEHHEAPSRASTDKCIAGRPSTEEVQESVVPRERAPTGRDQQSLHDDNRDHVISRSDTLPVRSGPPIEFDSASMPHLPPYQRVESQPTEIRPLPPILHGSRHDLYRSESDNYEERRFLDLHVQPEPPPAYEEHHEHPLYQPEINNTDRAENWL